MTLTDTPICAMKLKSYKKITVLAYKSLTTEYSYNRIPTHIHTYTHTDTYTDTLTHKQQPQVLFTLKLSRASRSHAKPGS